MSELHRRSAEVLRRRAEDLLASMPAAEWTSDLRDVSQLAHELAVHQAELELQNEALQEAQLALQDARDRFAALYEHAPVGYLVLDGAGVIRQANATWCDMLGRSETDFRGMPFADALAPEDAGTFLGRFRSFFRNPTEKQMGVRLLRGGETPFPARIEARAYVPGPGGDGNTRPPQLLMAVSDVSDLHAARSLAEERNAELAETNARLERTNRLLRAIRDVDQIIVSEEDRDRLIGRACANLTETMGYLNTWLALLDERTGALAGFAAAGLGEGCESLRKRLGEGAYPTCMRQALGQEATVVVDDPATQCPDCPVLGRYGGRTVLTRRLHFERHTYGVISVSVPRDIQGDPEEQALFEEMASDLAYAVHKIALSDRLRRSQRRYRALFENSRDGFVMVDESRQILDANEAYCEMLGYGLEELRGLPGLRAITPEHWHAWEEELWRTRLLAHGHTGLYEKEYLRKDGTVFPVEIRAYVARDEAGGVDYLWATVRDITERRGAEEAIARKQAELRAIYDSALTMMCVLDEHRRVLYANPAFVEFTGVTEDELRAGKACGVFGCINAGEHPRGCGYSEACPDCAIFTALVDTNLTGREHSNVEARLRVGHGGGAREMNLLLSTSRIELGDHHRLLLCLTDISGLKRTEEELRRRETLLARVFEILPVGLWFVDRDGVLIRGNRAGARIYGTDPDTLPTAAPGVRVLRLPGGMPVSERSAALSRTLRDGVVVMDELLEVRTADGRVRNVLNYTAPVLDDAGAVEGAVMVNLDVTEHRHLEEQLAQARKMDSVGRLAGGVAHDFNNMLNVILGHVELMLEDLAPGSNLRPGLEEIHMAAERSANLTRQLLAFARKQAIEPRMLDLNAVVEPMLKMLRRLIGEDIELVWRPGENLAPVHIDPAQVDQMLANLCVNARDAIGRKGGRVTIETGHATVDEAFCANHAGARPGDYVLLTVRDDGCGMDEATRRHIFEPFFTTKPVSQGTGLGLATVFGIVKQNHGFINVVSEPEEGTSFEAYLPRQAAVKSVPARAADAPPVSTGTETVLVVEDEPGILEMARVMLGRNGYTVLAARSPAEALAMARAHADNIDLLLTDVVMPGMNGRELARELLAAHPGLRCVFMSGYTADIILHQGVRDEGLHFIQKPFSRQRLAAKVREVLDGEGGETAS